MGSLDEKCNLLQQKILQKEKGKMSLVDNMLHRIASPFTDPIAAVYLPEKFKVHSIATFTGLEDPTEHRDNYQTHLDFHSMTNEVACLDFPLTLFGIARG